MSDQGEPPQEPHVHVPACGPAYFAEHGRWARVRHPRHWAAVRHEEAIRTYVEHGVESAEAAALGRTGLLRYVALVVVAYVSTVWLPDFAGYLVLLGLLSLHMREIIHQDRRHADTFAKGWIDGRMSLIANTFGNQPRDMGELLRLLELENHRDLEVVMAVRTAAAPDDLSGLEDEG